MGEVESDAVNGAGKILKGLAGMVVPTVLGLGSVTPAKKLDVAMGIKLAEAVLPALNTVVVPLLKAPDPLVDTLFDLPTHVGGVVGRSLNTALDPVIKMLRGVM